jgi:fructose-specific PTS system IIA-like component
LSNPRDPSFLRLLSKISADARAASRFVGTCGEMARDPLNLPLLIGLDLDEISTAAPEIPATKAAIARYSAAECRDLYARAQACATAAEVDVLVSDFRRRANARPLLQTECVAIGSDSASKAEAIDEIVGAFHATGRTEHPLAVEEAVWARETVYSTGLGHGFAIPHCKTDAIAASSIGVVRLAQPIEWASLDGEPVRCVILLAMRASDEDGTHMKVFAKLARKLMHEDFRARMLSAPDADAVVACMTEELG